MTTVAVTGVSGRVGQRLLRLLDADPSVTRVVGLDLREPRYRPRLLDFHALDVGRADLKPVIEGVDAVVHLAFVLEPLPDEAVMERVNVEGTRNVLEAVGATSARRLVHVSTGFAYGAWPNNPVPITEDAPLRPNTDFGFAVHQAETERMLAEWREDHPAVTVAVLRPPFVLGGGTPPAVSAIVRGRLPFRVRDAAPETQYLHVDDLVSAVTFAVERELDGTYNVAPDGWVDHDDAVALAGRIPRVAVPADVAERMLDRLWAAGIGDVPPGVAPLLQFPCVLANDRLRAAGWEPEHSTEDAILACVEESGAVSVGRRRGPWIAAAAASLGAAAAGGAAWALLRRSRR